MLVYRFIILNLSLFRNSLMTATDTIGSRKSGRSWKTSKKPIHTMTPKGANSQKKWKAKMDEKLRMHQMKMREREIIAQRNEEKEAERIRIEEKKRQQEENEWKQAKSQGQIVTDAKKIKKLEAKEIKQKKRAARRKSKMKGPSKLK